MKQNLSYIIVVISFILLSCSSPTEVTEDTIKVEQQETYLKIINTSEITLYLFVVEGEMAAKINWAPHFSDPKVEGRNTVNIEYSEILNDNDEPVKIGDELIIYYWNGSDRNNPKVFNKAVQL